VVGQSKEDISDCEGLRDVAMATTFGKNKPKITKFAITSAVCNISVQSWFWDRVYATGEFIYDTPVRKGQRGVAMATTFGTKIAINAYTWICTRDNENVITYNRVSVADKSQEDISDCKGLRDVAMATKFWPK